MSKRWAKGLWTRAAQRQMTALTRSALRTGSKLVKQSMKTAAKKTRAPKTARGLAGMTSGMAGARRYQLYRPPAAARRGEAPALVVMLHGCGQDARSFAASTRMNRLAATGNFLVLYPEQERMANVHGCWNWFEIRSGQAKREAASILIAVDQVCTQYQVDRRRVVVAGMSAGASMAALLALSYPTCFAAAVMHSGVGPGLANSGASGLAAMRGHPGTRQGALALAPGPQPALLVVQGSTDTVVAPTNGLLAAQRWAATAQAKESAARVVQHGARYPVSITDWTLGGRVVASLAMVQGLGHAWSGGPASQAYSDPAGPDASRMVWTFAQRAFAKA